MTKEDLINYIVEETELTKENVKNIIIDYGINATSFTEIITRLQEDIGYKYRIKRSLVDELEEEQSITREQAKNLRIIINSHEKQELEFIRDFDYSQICFDIELSEEEYETLMSTVPIRNAKGLPKGMEPAIRQMKLAEHPYKEGLTRRDVINSLDLQNPGGTSYIKKSEYASRGSKRSHGTITI